jgi:hypothetical protein
MGHLIGQLTNPNSALIGGGQPTQVGNTQSLLHQASQQLPSTSQMVGNDVLNPQSNPDATANLQKIGQPSFQQAASTGPGGMPNATSPGLSKGGKLVTLLTSGLQGALAGRAAQENEIAQSGGRRSGGVGTAFTAGYQLPWQRAQQAEQLKQQQAQTGLIQSEGATVPGPQGPIPAWLAKTILPAAIRGQSAEQVQQQKGQTATTVQGMKGDTAETVAGINKRFITVPSVGLYDTQTKSMIPNTAQGITITPELATKYNLPAEFVGKPLNLQNLASVQRSSVFENTPEMTAEGPIVVNRRTATAVPVKGPGGQRYSPPSMATPQQVADPNNPGQTTFVRKSEAFGQAGPQSASVQVPKQAMKAEVPTKIGDQKVAFTTMIQHAALLREATHALANGDMQTLNALQNKFKTEFGSAGPVTASAIADAYKGEVSNVINKGHITDQGNEKIAHTLEPNRQNYAQMDSVLGAYQSLAQSKMNMLGQQEQSAVNQSQIKKPGAKPAAAANDPLGLR